LTDTTIGRTSNAKISKAIGYARYASGAASLGRLALRTALEEIAKNAVRDAAEGYTDEARSEPKTETSMLLRTPILPFVLKTPPNLYSVPGYTLGADSPTADEPYLEGLPGRLDQLRDPPPFEDIKWFGDAQPNPDPEDDSVYWYFSKLFPQGKSIDFGGSFYDYNFETNTLEGSKKLENLKAATSSVSSPQFNLKEFATMTFSLSTLHSGGRSDPPPTIRTGTTYGTRSKNEGKSQSGQAAMQVLGAALDITSESAEYWEIIRDTGGYPPSMSNREVLEDLIAGGWEDIDFARLATLFALNLIIDKIIGPVLGHIGKVSRSHDNRSTSSIIRLGL